MMKQGIHPRLIRPPKLPRARHERSSGVSVPKKLVMDIKKDDYSNPSSKGKF